MIGPRRMFADRPFPGRLVLLAVVLLALTGGVGVRPVQAEEPAVPEVLGAEAVPPEVLPAGELANRETVQADSPEVVPAEEAPEAALADPGLFADEGLDEEEPVVVSYVADPLEPVNRLFFDFNDRLYFWLLKPVAKGYVVVVPRVAREAVGNFFFNLKTPIRLVNSVLQAKFAESGVELARFAINSTAGIAGLRDPARNWLHLAPSEEDLGQTLGLYGLGEGIYLCLPVFGPASLRDGVGLVGDYFLNPVSYLAMNGENGEALAVKGEETINQTSLRLGDYEAFKEATFDPYSAMRDAYIQSRRSKINDEPAN